MFVCNQDFFVCSQWTKSIGYTKQYQMKRTALVIALYLKQKKIVIEFKRFAKNSIIKKLDGVILISSSVIKRKPIFCYK